MSNIVTMNGNGTVNLNDGITMDLVREDDGIVVVNLYGVDVPEGESRWSYTEYEMDRWDGAHSGTRCHDALVAWLIGRGVDAELADDIYALTESIHDYGC